MSQRGTHFFDRTSPPDPKSPSMVHKTHVAFLSKQNRLFVDTTVHSHEKMANSDGRGTKLGGNNQLAVTEGSRVSFNRTNYF